MNDGRFPLKALDPGRETRFHVYKEAPSFRPDLRMLTTRFHEDAHVELTSEIVLRPVLQAAQVDAASVYWCTCKL
jgi:hypothetical protein